MALWTHFARTTPSSDALHRFVYTVFTQHRKDHCATIVGTRKYAKLGTGITVYHEVTIIYLVGRTAGVFTNIQFDVRVRTPGDEW